MTEKVTARSARQGRNGLRVFIILTVGLALMAIAFAFFGTIWS
ncbi:MAG: hypothetical protein AAFQ10_11515 [Pseudomonadota bacterium]